MTHRRHTGKHDRRGEERGGEGNTRDRKEVKTGEDGWGAEMHEEQRREEGRNEGRRQWVGRRMGTDAPNGSTRALFPRLRSYELFF